jgi:Immunity protein 26
MSRVKLVVGDVFTVPLDDRRFGLGQVVATYGKDAYFFALFEPAFARDEQLDLEQAMRAPVALLALSLDAKIVAGDWVVLGNLTVAEDTPLPAYKEMVGGPERVDVVDFSGERRRRAERGEADWLPNRKIVAPVRLERALKAKHGLEPWNEMYAALEPSLVATTARLFAD